MSEPCNFQPSTLAADGLRIFHGLSNWYEQHKNSKPRLIEWTEGEKLLTRIHCVKPKKQEKLQLPSPMERDTLYITSWTMSGFDVIRHLRNAFCHNGLNYNETTSEYEIRNNSLIKIAGRFSLEAILDFIQVYIQPQKPKKKNT